MATPLKWSYKTGLEADWCKSTADQKARLKAVNKIFSASIGQNCVVLVDDKSEKKDGSTVKVNIDSGDWKGEYLLSLPKQNADDSVDIRLCAYWKNDVFFLTTDATATAWDGGSYDVQKSRLSAHMLMYACRIVEPDGTVNIYYVSTKLNDDGSESRLLDVFPMLDRPLHYIDTAQDSGYHPVLPAYPIPSSVTVSGKTVSPFFGNLPDHMPGVFYSPGGEIGHDKSYIIVLSSRSIRMFSTGSVFFLVDA